MNAAQVCETLKGGKEPALLKSRSQLPAHARCLALRRETPSLWPTNGSNRRSTAAPLKVLPHFTPVGSCNHAATAGIKSPGSGLLGETFPSCPATLATNCKGTSAFTQHSPWLRNQCGLTRPPIPTALAASTRPHANPHTAAVLRIGVCEAELPENFCVHHTQHTGPYANLLLTVSLHVIIPGSAHPVQL